MKRFITALAICSLLGGAGIVYAADYTWKGATDQGWNTGTNWPGVGGYPDDSGDTAIIDYYSKSATQWPVLDTDRTIGSLTMRDAGDGTPAATQIDTYDGTARTLTVDNGANDAEFVVGHPSGDDNYESYVEKLGAGDIVTNKIIIQAPDNNSTTLVVTEGSIYTAHPS